MPDPNELATMLGNFGDTAANLRLLTEQIRSPVGVTPFVGVGMSVPFKFKAWKDFLLEQASDNPPLREKIEKRLAEGQYEEAAEELLLDRGENSFQTRLEDAFGPHRLAGQALSGAVTHLPKFATGPVLTTNFDGVLEAVFRHADSPFEEIILGMKLDKISHAFHLRRRVLVKLHGDATDRTDRVFTLGDYQKNYGDLTDATRHPLCRVLELAMRAPLLFLGCSLQQDRTMRVLETLAKSSKVLRHYAVLEYPSADCEFRQRQRYFSDLGVRPIWYPHGRHELIETLLAGLAKAVTGTVPSATRARSGQPRLSKDLPRPPADWVGRVLDEDRLVQALASARVVIIEGPRGAGKTALALRAIDRFVNGGRFDAIAWTSAAASEKRHTLALPDLLDAISLATDFPYTVQLPMPDKETALLDELKRKALPCLIVVDNFESIADPAIANFVNGKLPADCAALITSSERVDIGGEGVKVIAIEELTEAETRELFRRRTLDSGLGEVSDADFQALFKLVGGRPLAVDLVVGQMRGNDQELRWILEEFGSGTGDVFQKLMSQSWNSLSDTGRVVLSGACLFATDASEPALSRMCGLPTRTFREGIQKLRQRYLLRHVHTRESEDDGVLRYGVHPLTREFVRQKLPELGIQNDLCHRAGQYYLEMVREHGGSPDKEAKTDLRKLSAERPNIFVFFQSSYDHQDYELFLDLADTLSRWLFISGLWEQLDGWANRVIAVSAVSNHRAAGRVLNELGRVHSHRGQYNSAEASFAKAEDLARAARDPAGLGYIFHHSAECMIRQNRFEEAEKLLAKSFEQFAALQSGRDCIGVRYRLADLAYKRNDLPKAKQMFLQGLQETQEAKWERLEAYHRNFLGDIAVRENDLTEARLQYERALELLPETDTRRLAFLECSLAQLEFRANDISRAWAWAIQARDHFHKLGMTKECEDVERLILKLKAAKG
ncbi:MAG: SIR2 family protein [Verrucomicrobia bacterium]|nr:SIR2 family protein [Verrucomicrobiota bacterium]